MNVLKKVVTIDELREARAALPEPVGLVPTMGYLHEGHLSLVKRAREEAASVVVSVFVNPTQFAPTDDLDEYPRDLERDAALLQEAGADLLWAPAPEVMYPPGFQTWVEVEKVTQPLEDDGGHQTLQRRSAAGGGFRAKRCPTSRRHPADGAGPEHAH